jgi:hypothetical protein
VYSVGSGQRPVAGCCVYGDELLVSGATESVYRLNREMVASNINITINL